MVCATVHLPRGDFITTRDGEAVRRGDLTGCRKRQGTYKIANFRGLTMKTGVNISPIQIANIAKAASRRPPKTSNRSHRLTVNIGQRRSALLMQATVCRAVFAQALPSVTSTIVRSRRRVRESR
jgi:hypothetical protein